MHAIADWFRDRKLFQKILLFVLVCVIVELFIYLRINHSQVCQDCTSTNEGPLSKTVSLYNDTADSSHENSTSMIIKEAEISISSENISEKNSSFETSSTSIFGTTLFTSESSSFPSSTTTSTTGPIARDKFEKNQKCLQHLLDNNIVEYYYYPENDENNLNFSRSGLRTKKRLKNETFKPLLSLCFVPKHIYNETIMPPKICSKNVQNFMPNMMAREYDLVRNLLKFFKHVAALAGMEYHLNFGSLLGHVRFDKRPLPWDDDIDFSVDYSTVKRFKKIFHRERKIHFRSTSKKTFYPEIVIARDRMKIYDNTKKKIGLYTWTFPFLDLFYYSVPDEDFYDMTDEQLKAFVLTEASHSIYAWTLPIPVMLPLKKEIFLGVELMVPLDARKFLGIMNYEISSCRPIWWLHRFEENRNGLSDKAINCKELQGFYDF